MLEALNSMCAVGVERQGSRSGLSETEHRYRHKVAVISSLHKIKGRYIRRYLSSGDGYLVFPGIT